MNEIRKAHELEQHEARLEHAREQFKQVIGDANKKYLDKLAEEFAEHCRRNEVELKASFQRGERIQRWMNLAFVIIAALALLLPALAMAWKYL